MDKYIKSAIITILICLCLWQVYLVIGAHDMASLMTDMDNTKGVAVFIIYSQPLIWIFLALTVLTTIDIFLRKNFLILNSLASMLAFAVGTAIIHLYILVSGYAPIIELGVSK